ncbi:hypothetical protein TWF594_011408 [Orbilia oligospora]|nr:hypothetical protein TWF594_011408 [Orbilia oligospora]
MPWVHFWNPIILAEKRLLDFPQPNIALRFVASYVAITVGDSITFINALHIIVSGPISSNCGRSAPSESPASSSHLTSSHVIFERRYCSSSSYPYLNKEGKGRHFQTFTLL